MKLSDLEDNLLTFRQALKRSHPVPTPVAKELRKTEELLQEAQEHLQKARLIKEEITGRFE